MPVTKLPNIGRRNAIPILYTSGTYYEVGFDVGRTFRGLIEDFLSSFKALHEVYLPAYETPEGKKAYDTTLASLQENYPHYVRELQGTADGAKVPFLHLMLLHLDQIVPKNAGKSSAPSYGCSTFYCNNESHVILGHTEDALPETLNHIYIVSAHIKEEDPQGKWKTKQEGFTALSYAGHLPGFCMGYNHHGLVYSVNVIFPKVILAGKTPRHILTRALLAAETLEQAQSILRDRGVGSADGFSINMCFTQQEGDYLIHNAEVGPAYNSNESPMSVLTISPGENFAHTNKFQRLDIAEDYEVEGASSEHRLARVKKCQPMDTKEAIINLLSDTKDKEYPVFREGEDKDEITTITVGLFDLMEKTWTFWMKKPTHCEPIVTLPLIFKWNSNK